jgi:hypothetical protein
MSLGTEQYIGSDAVRAEPNIENDVIRDRAYIEADAVRAEPNIGTAVIGGRPIYWDGCS